MLSAVPGGDQRIAFDDVRPDKTLRIVIGERVSNVRFRYDDRLRNVAGLQYSSIPISTVTCKSTIHRLHEAAPACMRRITEPAYRFSQCNQPDFALFCRRFFISSETQRGGGTLGSIADTRTMNRFAISSRIVALIMTMTITADVDARTPSPEPLSSRVELLNGRPTIMINSTPETPLIYALTDVPGGRWSWEELPQHNIRSFAEEGIRLVPGGSLPRSYLAAGCDI